MSAASSPAADPAATVRTPPLTATPAPDGGAPAGNQAPAQPVHQWDRYKTPEDREKGHRELAKHVGTPMDDGRPYIGPGGYYRTEAEAKQGFDALNKVRGRLRPASELQQPEGGEQPAGETKPEGDGKPATPAPEGTKPLAVGKQAGGAPPAGEDEGVDEIMTRAGLKAEEVIETFRKDGKLSDEQFKAISKAQPGISRKLANEMAELRIAKAERDDMARALIWNQAAEMVGGMDKLRALQVEVDTYVPADELPDINRRLSDPKLWRGAMTQILAYRSAHLNAAPQNGRAAAPTGTGPVASPGGGEDRPFSSRSEMATAMNDERYAPQIHGKPNPKHDPGYRMSVLRRAQAMGG